MSTSTSFEFPEFYSFPPFFTLQTNPTTRAKQLEMWSELVHKWCSANKIKEIQVASATKLPVFLNSEINRELDDEDIVTILDTVQANGYGVWTLKDKSIFGFSDMKIPELATAMYKWADNFNKMNNISTLEEIANGYESEGESFHGMPLQLLYLALQELEKTGRVALVEGEDLQEMGVKFLSL